MKPFPLAEIISAWGVQPSAEKQIQVDQSDESGDGEPSAPGHGDLDDQIPF